MIITEVLGLPPGDLATWVGSVVVAATLGLLVFGTFGQRRETKRQADLDRSSQARMVGGWIDSGSDLMGSPKMTMTLQNSSPLAVRRVCGYLLIADGSDCVGRFVPLPVVKPGETKTAITAATFPPVLRLILAFDDDAGARWRKYGNVPLEQIDPSKSDLYGLVDETPKS